MTRAEFFSLIKKGGACMGGIDQAKASKGTVFAVACKWAKGGKSLAARDHKYLFTWLRDATGCDSYRCCLVGLNKKEKLKLKKLVQRVVTHIAKEG